MKPADCQPILQKSYLRETWQGLLPQLLPGVELFAQPVNFPLTSEYERGIATARRQFGAATLADGKRIAFYEIEVAPDIQLQSNRVGLRSLIAKCIDEVSAHAVLAFFVQPGKSFYRLTYAAKESRLGEDLKIRTEQTAPRRFTYILGEGESCRTAAERFGKLPSNTKIADLTEAFSVDKLNKEFFADFRKSFDVVVRDILARNKGWEHAEAERETQTLLNRLLFLYFIQRKGWLDRRRDYLAANFKKFHQDDPDGTSFNDKFLKSFFVKLSAEDVYFPNLELGDLPFLNGGLFDDEIGSLTERGRMKVGNAALRHVFDHLLEAYNFTVREDTPLDQEVAIDPEMIGKIFESLVLQLEQSDTGGKTSRHDTGSYYTPRPIVHYLCREGLRAWMEQTAPGKAKAAEWPARLEKLFALDASDGIDDDERTQLNELLTPDEARTLLDQLDDFRACDPAVGSGAFLVGLLHELVNLRRLCESRSRGKDPALDIEWLYETKKRVIENVLYGVDIQQRAVEICKLRLWISLMVDYPLEVDPHNCALPDFRRALKKITPLPNLDFKIRRADSLIEKIRGQAVKFPQTAADSRDFALSLNKLATAKHRFYEARKKKDKRLAQLDALDATAELAQYEFSAAKLKFGLLPSDKDADRVAELAQAEAEMGKLQMQIAAARKKGERDKDDDIERLSRVFSEETKPTFVWQLDFAEIFHRNGHGDKKSDSLLAPEAKRSPQAIQQSTGFDLILANPPFVSNDTIPDELKGVFQRLYRTGKRFDLYQCFLELGVELLQQNGSLAMILPNTFLTGKSYAELRDFLLGQTSLLQIVDMPQGIFENATVDNILLFLRRAIPVKASVAINLLREKSDPARVSVKSWDDHYLILQDTFNKSPNHCINLALSPKIRQIFASLEANNRLGDFFDVCDGLIPYKTAADAEAGKYTGFKPIAGWGKLLRGKGISRYATHWQGEYIHYGKHLWSKRDERFFVQPKIILHSIRNKSLPRRLVGTIDYEKYYNTDNLINVISREKDASLEFLLGLLNSKPINFWYKLNYPNVNINPNELRTVPVPTIEDVSKSIFIELVKWQLYLRGKFLDSTCAKDDPRDELMTEYFDQLLDALVYELFFSEELHKAGKYFFKPLAEENLPALDAIKGDKTAKLRTIFERLFDKEHVIRKNCFLLDTLETVRIIEGKA